MGKTWHWTDILGIHHSKRSTGQKDRPEGYGWTYKKADSDLHRKEREARMHEQQRVGAARRYQAGYDFGLTESTQWSKVPCQKQGGSGYTSSGLDGFGSIGIAVGQLIVAIACFLILIAFLRGEFTSKKVLSFAAEQLVNMKIQLPDLEPGPLKENLREAHQWAIDTQKKQIETIGAIADFLGFDTHNNARDDPFREVDPNLARIEVKGSAGNSKVFHFARETPPRAGCKPAPEPTRPHQTLPSRLARYKSPLLGGLSTIMNTAVQKPQAVQSDTPHYVISKADFCGMWVDETELRPPFVIDDDGQQLLASSTYGEIPYTVLLRPEEHRTCPAYTGGKGLPQGGYVRVVFCLVSPNVLRVEMDPVRRKVDRRQHFLMTRNTTSGDELLASNGGGHATGR